MIPALLWAQNPKKPKGPTQKAVTFYQQKDDKKAKSLAEQSLRQDSTFLKPYLLLGQLYENQQKIEEAVAHYLKGLSDNDLKMLGAIAKSAY